MQFNYNFLRYALLPGIIPKHAKDYLASMDEVIIEKPL